MSIALQRNTNHHRIDDLRKMPCVTILEPPEIATGGDMRFGVKKMIGEREMRTVSAAPCSSSSSSSSSIGKNSDLSVKSSSDDGEENEVQSSLKVSFNSAMDSLEEALPIRKGISRFYNGKSKSFASLGDASGCGSIKDIAKAENAYSRKRKNLLAYSLVWENKKPTSPVLRSGYGGRGITKRASSGSSRSTLALAVAMSASSENVGGAPATSPPVSPLASRSAAPWRSFSLADLQHCASAANSNSSSPLSGSDRRRPDEVS